MGYVAKSQGVWMALNEKREQEAISLPTVRLERKIGKLSAETMEQLKDALAFALDLQRV